LGGRTARQDSDRVLVLDHGRVAEFDKPRNLLRLPPNKGILSSMVESTGKQSARFLRAIAEGAIDIFGNVLKQDVATRLLAEGAPPPSATPDDPFDDANAVPDDTVRGRARCMGTTAARMLMRGLATSQRAWPNQE